MARSAIHAVVTLLVVAPGITSGEELRDDMIAWPSRGEEFRVSYTSKMRPIVINRIHGWVLHVETAGGDPVNDANIAVEGGMPEHDHGLPTVPAVTRNLGHGDYLVEGLRFHMNGYWEIELTITAGGETDTVVIPLTL